MSECSKDKSKSVAGTTAKTRSLRILVVDDQPGVRTLLRVMLATDGHTVEEAGNGVEALEKFATDRFDLVMTDFQMPIMKGDELAVEIKRRAPAQRLLMITSYFKDTGDPRNPVDAILQKPFTLADLRRVLGELG